MSEYLSHFGRVPMQNFNPSKAVRWGQVNCRARWIDIGASDFGCIFHYLATFDRSHSNGPPHH
jgi:hypothetical protein